MTNYTEKMVRQLYGEIAISGGTSTETPIDWMDLHIYLLTVIDIAHGIIRASVLTSIVKRSSNNG
jgi:hypothetical protein